MPRLLAGGPGLAVSPDHALLAVAGSGRLTLHDAATREETAATHVPAAESDVVFVSTAGVLRLVAFVRRDTVTEVRSFSVPELQPSGQVELDGAARPLTVIGERIICTDEAGERSRVVAVGAKALAADAIPLREPVQFALTTPEDQLLVSSRDVVEAWDVLLRRAMHRLNLPVQKPRQAGFAARRRLLWIASQQQLEVFRYSDGRLQLRVELGKRFVAADGHAESSRVVVALHPEGEPIELVAYDLALRERRDLEAGHPASFCVVEGTAPAVVTADADARLRFQTLGPPRNPDAPVIGSGGTGPDRPRPRTATPPVVVRHPDAPSRRLKDPADWRARMAHPEGGPPPPPVAAMPAAAPVVAVRARETSRVDTSREINWRTHLCGWAQELLDGREAGPPPIAPDSALDGLARRAELDEPARVALALLYGARLLGRPAVPAATVARALGDGEAAWQEALGRGALAARELAWARRGCLALELSAAHELDGKAEPAPT